MPFRIQPYSIRLRGEKTLFVSPPSDWRLWLSFRSSQTHFPENTKRTQNNGESWWRQDRALFISHYGLDWLRGRSSQLYFFPNMEERERKKILLLKKDWSLDPTAEDLTGKEEEMVPGLGGRISWKEGDNACWFGGGKGTYLSLSFPSKKTHLNVSYFDITPAKPCQPACHLNFSIYVFPHPSFIRFVSL